MKPKYSDKPEIVKSSDGKITFLKSEFKAMKVHDAVKSWNDPPEIVIWTDTMSGGQIFKYDTYQEALNVAKEIQGQL